MELLVLFLSRPGELVTRDQIARILWSSPEMVDTTAGINTAVNRLRSALHDDAEKPTYIETVVGLGYRFIAEVSRVDEAPAEATSLEEGKQNGTGQLLDAAAKAEDVGLPSTAVIHSFVGEASQVVPQTAPPDSPLVVSAGKHTWTIRALLLSVVLVVVALCAVWLRRSGGRHMTAGQRPAASFGFRQITFNDEANEVSATAVSHKGDLLAFADPSGITIRSIGVGADRFVASPEGVVIDRIAWSKDDQGLILSATDVKSRNPQVWFVGLDGGPARSLLDSAADAIVSESSGAILFTREQRSQLWMLSPGKSEPRRIVDGAGERFLPLSWIAKGNLVIASRCTLPNETSAGSSRSAYRCTYAIVDVSQGSVLSTDQELSANSASVVPEGRLLFPQNHDEGSGPRTLLDSADLDLRNGKLLSAPISAGTVPGSLGLSLSGSEDGRELALVVRRRASDIYAAELHNGSLINAGKLLHPAPDNYPHAWTSDSQSVIYESTQSGRSWIYQQRPGDADATLLARAPDEGALPQLTPDGKWVLFENLAANPEASVENALFRVPHNGGKLEIVPTHGRIDDFYCSISQVGICVLRRTVEQQFVFYKLDPVSGQGQELARTERVESEFGDWSVSPDGRQVALPLHSPEHSGIRLLNLCGQAHCAERDLAVSGAGEILETTWAPNSKDFFVEAKRDEDYALLRVDQSGQYILLKTSFTSIWGVPSRDGRRLAYPYHTTNTNVWSVERKAPAS